MKPETTEALNRFEEKAERFLKETLPTFFKETIPAFLKNNFEITTTQPLKIIGCVLCLASLLLVKKTRPAYFR